MALRAGGGARTRSGAADGGCGGRGADGARGSSITGLFGYLSGSKVAFDNATDSVLELRVDGKRLATLTPSTYVEKRLAGGRIEVELFEGGKLVESATLKTDADFAGTVSRILFGKGSYVYNIGAANEYSIGAAHYSR